MGLLTAEQKKAAIKAYNEEFPKVCFDSRLFYFYREISLIKNPELSQLLCYELINSPNYIWYCPASLSGNHFGDKYIGVQGLLLHLKAVFYRSLKLFEKYYEKTDCVMLDQAKAASIMHDLYKYGIAGEIQFGMGGEILNKLEHASFYADKLEKEGNFKDYPLIIAAVREHMGRFGLNKPSNNLSNLIADADFDVSRGRS
jgi:hypothetical protein